MSAERTEHSAVRLPFDLTLEDVAEMNESDELDRRFELSPEGVLSVMPPPTVEHQIITSQLIVWFAAHGWPPERVLPAVGLRTEKQQRYGGRIPDLTVWSARPPGRIWPSAKTALVVVEIAATSTAPIDRSIKRDEYAASGIQRYWMVGQDAANTVTMLELDGDGYRQVATHPLAWLLNTDPRDYLTD